MNTELFNWVKDILSQIWSIFLIQIPGTSFTFAALGIGLFLVDVTFRIINYISGFGFGGVSGVGTAIRQYSDSVKGGNNKHIKPSAVKSTHLDNWEC